jgi:ABC-type polar amino acid transport system ATPase subunit
MSDNTTEQAVLILDGIKKSFGAQDVLAAVSLVVQKGQVVSLIGPSGSGKSTILRCIDLLEEIDAGRITFCGEVVSQVNGDGEHRFHVDPKTVRQRIGFVFQHLNLWPHKTALENVIEGPLTIKRVQHSVAKANGMELLNRVGLTHKARALPRELSGGEQQRVAIARALAMDPELLLLDEITANLDPELIDGVLAIVEKLADEGTTILIVSHELPFVKDVSDRVLFLSEGAIQVKGTPHSVFYEAENPALKRFLQRFTRSHLTPYEWR